MTLQRHALQSTKQKRQKSRTEHPNWIPWIVAFLVLLVITASAGLWIWNSSGSLPSIITAIFAALGAFFTFVQVLQALFPPEKSVTTSPSHHSLQSTQLTNDIPSSLFNQRIHSNTINESLSPDPGAIIPRRFHREDKGEAPHIEQFYGREKEQTDLKQWILSDHCRIVAILGMGGIGKTTLAASVIEQISDKFEYIIWRSLQNAPPVENILKSCIAFLSDHTQYDLPRDLNDQILLLIKYLREHRCLVILDNLEAVLRSGNHTSEYQEGYEGYGTLIQRLGEVEHQSCLLLTSREKPKEISRLEGNTQPIRSMQLHGVELSEARKLLENEGLFGPDETWATFIQLYAGNPLALKLVSEPIRELFQGNIATFLKEEVIIGDIDELLNKQFSRLSEIEQEIMYWLASERETVSLYDLREDIVSLISKGELLDALKSLRRRSMIEIKDTACFYLQPVIMEYVTNRFIKHIYEEIITESLKLLRSHVLIKAQAKEYIRDSHIRLMLYPLLDQLLIMLEKEDIERKLTNILTKLRKMHPQTPNYAAGNILNLLIHLDCDLRSYDFSHLIVWQAYLQGISLCEVNFAYADLSRSVFTDTFGRIFSIALSSEGKWLAAGTANGEIRLWDIASSTPLHTFEGHTEWVRSVAFSPNDNIIASGSEDQTVRLWEISTNKCLKVLEGHGGRVYSVTFSPDGSIIASGSDDQTIRLWDTNTGECLKIMQEHSGRVYSVAFSPDGNIVVSSSRDQTIRLWDTNTGECLRVLLKHTNRVRSVAFSPDGNTIASGSEDQTIRLWNVSTGECLRILQGHTSRIWSVTFSPNGNFLASGSDDQTVRLWDANTGDCIKVLQGHGCKVYSVAISSDGNTVACGSGNQTVRLWDANTGDCLKTLQGYGSKVYSVAFSPDGNTIASGSEDQTVRLWNVSTGECLKTLRGHAEWVLSVAFSKGLVLASGGEDWTVRLWNVHTGECFKILQESYRVYSVAFGPNEEILANGSGDQTVKLWEVSTGKCLKVLEGHNNRVYSVAFSPDGNTIVSGSDDQTVKLWNANTGECLKTLYGHTSRVKSVAFSPDGNTIASGSDDQTVKLWNTKTGECLRVLQEHCNRVCSVTFSPDGNTIASGSEEQTLRLWDTSTGKCLRVLHGYGSTVYSVAFSPNRNIVASSSYDGTIQLWNMQTGKYLQTLKCDRPYERMNITNVRGLTVDQKATLKVLGAIENDERRFV